MNDGKIQFEVGAANQPRTLFKPGSWLAKIDFINHLILFNNVLITLLSEKEGGKTSFSTLLQTHLDQQIKLVSLTATPSCDEQSIISHIAAQLNLNINAESNIEAIAAQVNELKSHVLIIIDDAQHLPESLIKEAMIAIKKQEDFGFFHLCLVSDHSLVTTLNKLAVDQFNNLIHTIELGPLNESETRTYVLQRAMTARLINRPLTDIQYKQFYQLTKGNLAKINASLESFIYKCSTQKTSTKVGTVKRASMAVSAAVAVGVCYLYFSGLYNDIRLPQMMKRTSPSPIEKIVEKAQSTHNDQLVSYIASWQDLSTHQLVHYASPKKQILDDLDIDNEEENLTTVAIVDKVVVIPTVNAKAELLETQLPVAPTAAVQESKLVKIKEFSQKKLAKNSVVKKSDSGKYTIQLVASHKVSDIHRFRTSNKLLANTKVRHFTNAKGTWYILTLGEYASRTEAQLKTSSLPSEFAKLKPWIRPVAGLTNVG